MGKVLNCANTPVDKAIAYAQEQCSADGKSMAEYFSDFKTNYLLLQDKCELALDLPRIEMPVIEPEQMDEFQESLSKGHIDVKEPVAKSPQSKSKYPTDLGFDLRGRQWLYRGTRDGAIEDDILDAKMTEIAVADLKPSQSQIWLEKVVGMSLYFGPLKQSSEFLHEAPIIVSSDGYILDGHHRFGAAMVSNPSLKLTALKVDMEIRELVKMARSYGNAIGNEQKAAESFEAEGKVGKNKWLQAIYDAIYDENDHSYKIMYHESGQYGYPISTSASLIEISMTQKALADGKKPPTERQVKNGMLKAINEASGQKLNPKGAKNYGATTKASYEYNGKRFFVDYTVNKPLRGAKESYTLEIIGEEYFENPMLFGRTSKDDALHSYEAETFEAEMDKVVDVDCVNIVSKKSAFTGKDRNFYRVSFRDSGQYDRFGIPAWASKAAKTMGEKYYGVSGCQMVMGMLPSGKWQIQAILIPNTEKMNKQKALKIANHMQDRIEKEGKWAKKKCREDEIIQIYQADEYGAESYDADGRDMTLEEIEETYGEGRLCDHCFDGTFERGTHDDGSTYYRCWKCKQFEAESFDAMSFNQWSQDEMNEELHGGRNMQFKEWLDDEVHTHGNIPLKEWGYEEEHDEPEHQHAETFNADVDTETKDYWYDNIKNSWEGYGLERYQNAKLNRSMKSCVKDWIADNPNELAYMVQDNHEINEEAMDGNYKMPSKQMMKKEVAYLKSVFRKVADEMDKNGEWSKYSHKVNFDAESMMKTYKVQVKRIEGGDSQIVEIEVESDETDMESLMDEIEIAVANELQTWDFGALTVVSGPHYQMAESMARKPAYGLFGLSFITGLLLNMARKD